MAAYSYNSGDITLLVGLKPMFNFGDNKVTISRNNDTSTIIEGLDGDNTFAKSNKKAGTVSFDLLYMSSDDLFMDQLSNANFLVAVSFLHGAAGKTLITTGMVMTQPDIVAGEEPDSRTWVISVDSVDMSLAGVYAGVLATPDIVGNNNPLGPLFT